MIKGVRNMTDRKFKRVEDLRKDNFNRVMSEVDVHESIMAIIKYYGDCRKAIKDLHDRGINVTEDQLYHLKCGTHRAAIEKFMPLSEFRKLKERKIRIVCESLVRNNGSVMDTYKELKHVIPFINTVYIEKILYKEKRPDISDEYFDKDQYKKQDYCEPGSVLYEPFVGSDEEWRIVKYKDVKEDMYEVSNYGRVRNTLTGKNVALIKNKGGYIYAHLMCENNFRKSMKDHQLVATAFIPNPNNKPIVNHMDLNPSNNYYKNLEWATHDENMFHSVMNHNFTGADHDSVIRKRTLYLTHMNVPNANEYSEMHDVKYMNAGGSTMSYHTIFDTINNALRCMNDDKTKLMFNDLIYIRGVYIGIYTVNPTSYVSVFIIPSEMLEEMTTIEIRHLFNGRAIKVKDHGYFTSAVTINYPLDEPYWNNNDVEEFSGVKLISKSLPYEINRYAELVVDKIMKS